MNELQQQINDLVQGKHKQWHLEALKTHEYGELGWEWLHGQESWHFIVGFDYEDDAKAAMAEAERLTDEGRPYGATQYEFRISERVGA